MKITRQITADKISDYLQGRVAQAEPVDWAERAMMDEEFEPADAELLSDIIGRLGLADVAAVTQARCRGTRPGFQLGLRWRAVAGATFTEGGADAERMRLGDPGNRDSRDTISDSEDFLRRLGYRATVTVSTAGK